jgi:hypothetical protein
VLQVWRVTSSLFSLFLIDHFFQFNHSTSKTRTPNIPSLVHIQEIEEVNADESVEVNSQVSMICLLIGSQKQRANTMRIFESNN